MQSHDKSHTEDTVIKTILLLVAVALNILELFIPRIPLLPWLKPGLANSITIIWLIRFGLRDALLFTCIRVWISSFYFGLSLVTISLALSGGITATLGMGLLWKLRRPLPFLHTGTIGIAISGALLHNAGQLCAVYLLLARNSAIVYQLPAMGIASLLFGTFTGILTPILWNLLIIDREEVLPANPANNLITLHLPLKKKVLLLVCGAIAIALLFIENPVYLTILAGAAITGAAATSSSVRKATIYPLRFWFLFLFIALFNLFFSYGNRITTIPFITVEGCNSTLLYSLRLLSWLEISLILQALHANTFFYRFLRKVFPHRASTLAATLYALEYFPDVIAFAKSHDARNGLSWHTPAKSLHEFSHRVTQHIISRLRNGSDV